MIDRSQPSPPEGDARPAWAISEDGRVRETAPTDRDAQPTFPDRRQALRAALAKARANAERWTRLAGELAAELEDLANTPR